MALGHHVAVDLAGAAVDGGDAGIDKGRADRIFGGVAITAEELEADEQDDRNDTQVIIFDQLIPGSTFTALVNADHWAIAVPVARSHSLIGSTFVDKNDYPREAFIEALLRFVEEDLER